MKNIENFPFMKIFLYMKKKCIGKLAMKNLS